MARTRNIKPGFFVNEDLADCGPVAMLLFAGLWTIADRDGRLEDRPKRIKLQTVPYFDCDVDEALDCLAEHRFIERYEVAGGRYIQVSSWAKHQQPHVKEQASTIPAPIYKEEAPYLTGASRVQVPDNTGTSTELKPLDTSSLNLDTLTSTTTPAHAHAHADAREAEPTGHATSRDVTPPELEPVVVDGVVVAVNVNGKAPPGDSRMPPEVREQIALRDYLVEKVETLFRRGLTKAHKNRLNEFFTEHKTTLTREIVDGGVKAAADETDGDGLNYALKVMHLDIFEPNRPKYQHARSGGGTPKPASSTNGSGGGNARDDPARADMPQPGYSWEKNPDGTWRKHGIYDGRWNYGLESLAAVRERDKHEHDTYLKQRRSRTGALQTT